MINNQERKTYCFVVQKMNPQLKLIFILEIYHDQLVLRSIFYGPCPKISRDRHMVLLRGNVSLKPGPDCLGVVGWLQACACSSIPLAPRPSTRIDRSEALYGATRLLTRLTRYKVCSLRVSRFPRVP